MKNRAGQTYIREIKKIFIKSRQSSVIGIASFPKKKKKKTVLLVTHDSVCYFMISGNKKHAF